MEKMEKTYYVHLWSNETQLKEKKFMFLCFLKMWLKHQSKKIKTQFTMQVYKHGKKIADTNNITY